MIVTTLIAAVLGVFYAFHADALRLAGRIIASAQADLRQARVIARSADNSRRHGAIAMLARDVKSAPANIQRIKQGESEIRRWEHEDDPTAAAAPVHAAGQASGRYRRVYAFRPRHASHKRNAYAHAAQRARSIDWQAVYRRGIVTTALLAQRFFVVVMSALIGFLIGLLAYRYLADVGRKPRSIPVTIRRGSAVGWSAGSLPWEPRWTGQEIESPAAAFTRRLHAVTGRRRFLEF